MTITVDEAAAADIEAMIVLESLLFVEDAGVHDPHADTSWPHREGRADFEQLLGSADALVLIAKSSGEPVGFLAGYASSSSPTRRPVEYAVLRSLYVDASARRAGVARMLSQRFVDWARARGCVEVQVDHYAANTRAAALYASLGFEPQSLSRTLPL